MYPENRQIADTILIIPQKGTQKPLIGFLDYEDILKVFLSDNPKIEELMDLENEEETLVWLDSL